MSLTKQELAKVVVLAVKKAVNEEIKKLQPVIKKTIREEFYKILDESDEKQQLSETRSDYTTVASQYANVEQDSMRQEVEEKIFKNTNPFSDILNQTVNEVVQGTGYPPQAMAGQPMVPPQAMAGQQPQIDPSQFGYDGGFDMVGADANVPGTEQRAPVRPQAPRPPANAPVNVPLPTHDPEGKPINFGNVPANLVQNMMKNYGNLMERVDEKAKQKRGIPAGSGVSGKKTSAKILHLVL